MSLPAQKAEALLHRAVTALVLDEPFYGHLLSATVRTADARTQTASVSVRDDTVVLSVGNWFAEALTDAERVAVIKHEALHLVFRHLFRRSSDQIPLLFNLAADLVVNQYIGRHPLPAGALTLDTFEDLELPSDSSVEIYYERLHTDLLAHPDSERWRALTLARRNMHEGWIPSAQAGAALDRLLARSWARTSATERAQLPASICDLVDALLVPMPPRVDWRRLLRLFCVSSARSRMGSTLRRPSRRYKTSPGPKVRPHNRLLVAIDTSGSISDSDLSDFFAEITAIWRQGASVFVLECDDAVRRVYPFDGSLPARVAGRGYTSFDPVFRWLSADDRRWDALIYLTDGYGAPLTTPPHCPLLWVLSRNSSDRHLVLASTGERVGQVLRLIP